MTSKKTFKALSIMLMYPTVEIQSSLKRILHTLQHEAIITQKNLQNLAELIDFLQNSDLLDLQEQYVDLFDKNPSLSLYLFEHVYGEMRDRGQAMVDLTEHYEKNGLSISQKELPDYLPLFLEFLSTIDYEKALDLLGEPITIIAILNARLKLINNKYYYILAALEDISKIAPDQKVLKKSICHNKIKITCEEIDQNWEETEAFATRKKM